MFLTRPRSTGAPSWLGRFLLLGALLALACGCSEDSPTAPQPDPRPPTPTNGAVWNITVTTNPNSLAANASTPSQVRVVVRRASDNALPGDGTTVAVTTSLGSFSDGQQVRAVAATLIGGQSALSLFAEGVQGTAVVSAQLENSIGRASVIFEGAAAFFVENVSPNIGHPNGNETVRVNGGGFEAPVRVNFGGVSADVVDVQPTVIRVRTPPVQLPQGSVQSVSVDVTTRVGTEDAQTDGVSGAFTYSYGSINGPQVYSVTPNTGPNEGGTQVRIRGDGFQSPVQVLFGNTAQVEATVQSVTSTEIVAVTPAATGFGQSNVNQSVAVTVRNLQSGQVANLIGGFRYGVQVLVTALSPGEGPYTGGTTVTIYGQGFDEPVAVEYGGRGQVVISVTGTQIITRSVGADLAGCADERGPVRVTNIESGASDEGPEFIYRAFGPTIGGVSPGSGPQAGGNQITITGSGFAAPLAVEIGDARATVVSVTPNQVVVIAPSIANSDLDTEACTSGTSTGEQYVPTRVDIRMENAVTTCEDVATNVYTYTPADTSCRITTTGGGGGGGGGSAPVAGFTFTTSGLQVTFTDTSTGGVTAWAWDFDNNGTTDSTVQNPVHTYAAGGTYTVKLTVTNLSSTDDVTQNVTVP